jgi:hypothetical protein
MDKRSLTDVSEGYDVSISNSMCRMSIGMYQRSEVRARMRSC